MMLPLLTNKDKLSSVGSNHSKSAEDANQETCRTKIFTE
jgi:hypothetical protein